MKKTMLIAAGAALLLLGANLQPASADGWSGAGTRFIQGYAEGYEHGYTDAMSAEHEEFEHHHGHRMYWMMEKEHTGQHKGCGCGEGYSSKKSFEKLSSQLGLEGEQKEKVRALLNEEVKKVDAFYKQVHEKELQEIQETQKKVGELLKGEQKEKWEKMMQKGIDKFKHYMEKTGLQEEEEKVETKKQK
jgi:hypothetical protein